MKIEQDDTSGGLDAAARVPDLAEEEGTLGVHGVNNRLPPARGSTARARAGTLPLPSPTPRRPRR